MPSYQIHNPQHQWRLLADKQFHQSKLRQQHQQKLQKQIKQRYLHELTQQIKSKQKALDFQTRLEKSVDRIEIEKSVQDQKRAIEIQKLKNLMIMDRTNKIDEENLSFQQQKKKRQLEIKQIEISIEKAKHQEAQMLINYQKEKQEKKKQYFRLFLKSTMEKQNQRKRILLQRQRQLQKAKLKEMERIQRRNDEQRQKELQRLKERAKKVDYGSHSVFERNQNKSLIQKKSEQWQTYKDAIQREEILKKMEEEQRIGRKVMEKYYSKQLRKQILQKDQERRQKSLSQKERDRSLLDESQRFAWMVEEQKRSIENQKKKQLYKYLQIQHEQKEFQKRNQNAMKQHQLKLNLDTLVDASTGNISDRQTLFSPTQNDGKYRKNSYSTLDVDSSKYYARPTPGDTFRLDSHRLKQFETLSKSLKNPFNSGPNQKIDMDLKSHRYFANKGFNILN